VLEETDLRVVECVDAEEAMATWRAKGEYVALVFADVASGILDGVDLARRVKALWPHVSMVVTSGYARGGRRNFPTRSPICPKPWLALEVLMQAEKAADWMHRAQRV
jgi:CheY-like chemotaxis protein